MFSRESWPRILPFAVYIAFIVIADLLGRAGMADLRWLYAVKIGIVAAILAFYWRQYTELAHWDLRPAALLLSVIAGVVVLVLWINLDAGWMVVGASAGFDPHEGERINWLLVAVRVAGAALVVPVMEELFWRSWLMRWIASADFLDRPPAHVGVRAFVVTMVLFGVEHNQWLAGMVAGSAYAWLYMRNGSLWSAVIAHGVTNGLLGAWIIATGEWTYW